MQITPVDSLEDANDASSLTPDQVISLRQAFKLFDQDNSGAISTKELRAIFTHLGERLTYDECKMMVSEFSCKESKNTITFDDFCSLMGRSNKKSLASVVAVTEREPAAEGETVLIKLGQKSQVETGKRVCGISLPQSGEEVDGPVFVYNDHTIKRLQVTEGTTVAVSWGPILEQQYTVFPCDNQLQSLPDTESDNHPGFFSQTFAKPGKFYLGSKSNDNQQHLKLQISVISDNWRLFKKLAGLLLIPLLIGAVFGIAILVARNWLLDENNDVMMPDQDSKYGAALSDLRSMFVKHFLPAFAAGLIILLLMPVVRIMMCFTRTKLTSFGQGFNNKIQSRVLNGSLFAICVVVLLIVCTWMLHMQFLEAMRAVASEIVSLGQETIDKVELVLDELLKIAIWYNKNIAPVPEDIDRVNTLKNAINATKEWTDHGQEMLVALNRVQMILMFLLLQISLACCAIGVAGVVRRSSKLMRAMMWASGISLVFFCFSYAIEKPMAECFKQLEAETSGGAQGMGDSQSNPMVAIFANCEGDDGYTLNLDGMVENMEEFSGAMGVKVPMQPNMTLRDYKNTFLYVQQQIDNLEHHLILNNYTQDFVDSQIQATFNSSDLTSSKLILPLKSTMEMANVLMSVINCDGVMERFQRMGSMLRTDIIKTASGKAGVQAALCFMFFVTALCGVVAKYVIDRPVKRYHCKETNRWFKYEVCRQAHEKVLAKYQADHAERHVGKRIIHALMSRGVYWRPPPYGISTVISDVTLTYISCLIMLVLQSILVVLAADQGKIDVVFGCWCCLAASCFGLYGSWDNLKRNENKYALLISMLFVLLSIVMFIHRIKTSADKALECKELYESKTDKNCTFAELGDLAMDTLFCVLLFLMGLIVAITGTVFFCLRSRIVTASSQHAMDGLATKNESQTSAETRPGSLFWKQWLPRFRVLFILGLFALLFFLPRGDLLKPSLAPLANQSSKFTSVYVKNAITPPIADPKCAGSNGLNLKCCNGVPGLCDKRYDQVVYFTSHNMHSSQEDSWVGPNNDWTLRRGLNFGVRGIMLDLYPAEGTKTEPKGEHALVCHGTCAFGFGKWTDTCTTIKQFLDDNPTEVLTLIIEQYATKDQLWKGLKATGLDSYLHAQAEANQWPTLGEMVQSNKRLVMFNDQKFCGVTGYDCVSFPKKLFEFYGLAQPSQSQTAKMTSSVEYDIKGEKLLYTIEEKEREFVRVCADHVPNTCKVLREQCQNNTNKNNAQEETSTEPSCEEKYPPLSHGSRPAEDHYMWDYMVESPYDLSLITQVDGQSTCFRKNAYLECTLPGAAQASYRENIPYDPSGEKAAFSCENVAKGPCINYTETSCVTAKLKFPNECQICKEYVASRPKHPLDAAYSAEGFPTNKLYILNHFLTNPVPGPMFAKQMNIKELILKRSTVCAKEMGHVVNFLAVDYWSIGSVYEAVIKLNNDLTG